MCQVRTLKMDLGTPGSGGKVRAVACASSWPADHVRVRAGAFWPADPAGGGFSWAAA
jgi:hypothetical protein